MLKKQPISALYCRLSVDDDDRNDNNSVSIETQRKKLISFAITNNMLYDLYIDDGISGTTFNRPALNQLMKDIEVNKVNCVIVKDLSRLGRNYLECGNLLENVFPQKKIRFIAIDDNIDRDPLNPTYETNLMIPMFNLMNEYYPADISKKTRSALRTKAKQGEYLGSFAPYGYKKSPTDKHKLIVDEEQAKIIKYIFNEIAEGTSLSQLVRTLHFNKVKTSMDYRKGTNEYNWNCATISRIIENEVYIGTTIFNKTSNLSYKNRARIKNNTEKWIVVENTHEPIVSENLFKLANEVLNLHKRTAIGHTKQPFLSVLLCKTCGNYLNYTAEPRQSNPDEAYYTCRTNRRFGKGACTRHYIRYSILSQAVMNNLRYLKSLGSMDRQQLYKQILSQQKSAHQLLRKPLQKELKKYDELLIDNNKVFVKLYSDYALNKICEDEYNLLKSDFDSKNNDILKNKNDIISILKKLEDDTKHIDLFIDLLIDTPLDDISFSVIHKLIDKIYVHDCIKEYGNKTQYIEIHYKHIGCLGKLNVYNY